MSIYLLVLGFFALILAPHRGASARSLTMVEHALTEMESDLERCAGTQQMSTSSIRGSAPSPTQHLLNPKSRAASSGTSVVNPGVDTVAAVGAGGKTAPRTLVGNLGVGRLGIWEWGFADRS